VGIAGALLAAASGYTDFHETYGHERRLALLHGLLMTLVVVVMLVSLGMRLSGAHMLRLPAVELSTLAYLTALGAAYVGGHLPFGLGTMVNHNAFADGPADYVKVGAPSDFAEGRLVRVDAGGLPTLVVRLEGKLHAIGAVCSHAGGPLEEGKLDDCIVTCPWHASRFDVRDGSVKGGPATFSQPQLVTRERDGTVEVKLAHPLH
jgi:nitrite reductase/ring-hydroxylating ferredoxin subunit